MPFKKEFEGGWSIDGNMPAEQASLAVSFARLQSLRPLQLLLQSSESRSDVSALPSLMLMISSLKTAMKPLYTSLDADRSQIRLLTLLSGNPADSLRCRIEIRSLDYDPSFETLSYV